MPSGEAVRSAAPAWSSRSPAAPRRAWSPDHHFQFACAAACRDQEVFPGRRLHRACADAYAPPAAGAHAAPRAQQAAAIWKRGSSLGRSETSYSSRETSLVISLNIAGTISRLTVEKRCNRPPFSIFKPKLPGSDLCRPFLAHQVPRAQIFFRNRRSIIEKQASIQLVIRWRARQANFDFERMCLRKLFVNRAPRSIAPGNAVGIKNVAVQIALRILQRHLVRRTQIRTIVARDSL